MVNRDVNVPEGHPYRDINGFVDAQRTKAELDDIFQFDQNNLEREDVEVNHRSGSASVDKTRSMTDDEFETYKNRAKQSEALTFNGSRKEWVVQPAELDSPDPLKVHTDRPRETMETDKNRKARVTTDVETYASDPEAYDFPFLDTPSQFEDEVPNFDEAGFLERQAGDDGVFRF